jgi:hypothetical protein
MTDYTLSKTLVARELFGGRLEALGIHEHMTSNRRCLTDGDDYVWVYMSHDGSVSCLKAYAPRETSKIVDAISRLFEIDIYGEHEPQYWGFATHEEWDVAKKKAIDQARHELYDDVCACVRGEPVKNKSWHIGKKANIGKGLVKIDAALLRPEKKDELLDKIDVVYDAITPAMMEDIPF